MIYLVAIDGSLNANACIETLCNMPIPSESHVHVISIWDHGPVFVPYRMMQQRAESLVDEAINRLKIVFGDVVTGEALPGNVISKILETVECRQVHTTLVGAHSRKGFTEILMGNVAKEVLRKSKSSVVIVRVNSLGEFVAAKRYLVCIDASPVTQRILRSLESRLWSKDTEMRILHILEPDTGSESEDPKRDAELCLKRISEKRLQMQNLIDIQIAAMNRAFPEMVITGQIIEEIDGVEGILSTAKYWNADSLILGSHGRTGFERIWLGSVSEDVSMRANCTVEIVR